MQHQHQGQPYHPHPPHHPPPDPAPPHHHPPSLALHAAQVWPSPRRSSSSSAFLVTPSPSVHADSRWTGRRPLRHVGTGEDTPTTRPTPAESAHHPPSSAMSAATPIDDDMARLNWARRASTAQVPHHPLADPLPPTSSLFDPGLNRLQVDGRRGSTLSLHHPHPPPTTTTSNRAATREKTTTTSSDLASAILPSLQIPPSINDSKGSLAEFAAQVSISPPPPLLGYRPGPADGRRSTG